MIPKLKKKGLKKRAMAAILSADVVKKGRVKVVRELSSDSNQDRIQKISGKAESWHSEQSER